jgi:hypothetical protein
MKERALLIAVKRALLLLVAAIDAYLNDTKEKPAA